LKKEPFEQEKTVGFSLFLRKITSSWWDNVAPQFPVRTVHKLHEIQTQFTLRRRKAAMKETKEL